MSVSERSVSKGSVAMVAHSLRPATVAAFAETVRAGGYEPVLVTRAGEPAPDDGFGAVVRLPDLHDPVAVATGLRELRGAAVAGVLSWSDATITVAAQAAELLGVARCPAAAIEACRNKYAMRRRLHRAGLAGPPFALVSTELDAHAAARVASSVGLPAIVKPVNGSGSCLVRRVASVTDLREACRHVAANAGRVGGGALLTPAVTDPDGPPVDATASVLVEGALFGPEIDAEIVVQDGVVHVTLLFQVVTDDGDDIGGHGFAYPLFDPSPEYESRLTEAIRSAVAALGLDNTTANVTLIDDAERGPTIVEMNAGRFGGQLISRLVFDLTGADVRRQHLAVTVGEPLRRRRVPPPGVSYAAMTIFAAKPGRVTALHGLDRLRSHPQVALVEPQVESGDLISGLEAVYAISVVVRGFGGRAGLRSLYRELCDIAWVETGPG